jgi:hypothetical protein
VMRVRRAADLPSTPFVQHGLLSGMTGLPREMLAKGLPRRVAARSAGTGPGVRIGVLTCAVRV